MTNYKYILKSKKHLFLSIFLILRLFIFKKTKSFKDITFESNEKFQNLLKSDKYNFSEDFFPTI